MRVGGAARRAARRGAASSPRKIAAKSPKALRLAKWSLNGIELLDLKKSYRFEQGFTLELYTSPDSQEARDAFVEKRDAQLRRDEGAELDGPRATRAEQEAFRAEARAWLEANVPDGAAALLRHAGGLRGPPRVGEEAQRRRLGDGAVARRVRRPRRRTCSSG